MIGIIIVLGGLFVLYQLGILKFGSSENNSNSFGSSSGSVGGGLSSFIPSFKEQKITSYRSPNQNSYTYKSNPYGIQGKWAEVLYEEIPPEMKLKMDEVKENNRLYKEEESIIKEKDKEIARNMCEQILSIISTQKPSTYKNAYTMSDGVQYGNRLKYYTEYGALGYFSYLVLDGSDVCDFIGKFFNINALFNSKQIVEK